jgi:hypothetical protein
MIKGILPRELGKRSRPSRQSADRLQTDQSRPATPAMGPRTIWRPYIQRKPWARNSPSVTHRKLVTWRRGGSGSAMTESVGCSMTRCTPSMMLGKSAERPQLRAIKGVQQKLLRARRRLQQSRSWPKRIDAMHQQQTKWGAHPRLLNTPNGTIDLRTGKMRAHQPKDYLTKTTAVGPSTDDCPKWKAHLNRILNADAELIAYVQRMLGYSLTGVTTEHALFFCYGTGANGKGALSTRLPVSSKTMRKRRASKRSRRGEMIVTQQSLLFCEAQGSSRSLKRKKAADGRKAR